jgi:hypothetical protein
MRKILFTLFAISFAIQLFGQDFLILRNAKQDTIWGDVKYFGFGKVNVTTSNGNEKYKLNEVYEFEYNNYNFISIPFELGGYIVAVREIAGTIDLYNYDVNIANIDYTNDASFEASLIDLLVHIVDQSLDSYYLRKGKEEAVKVYNSSEKFAEYTAQVFKDDPEIYEEIINEKYNATYLEQILEEYNRKYDNEYFRIEKETNQTEEKVTIKLNPTKASENRLRNELKKLESFTSLKLHPSLRSECDSCYNEIGATTMSDSMNIVLKSGLILKSNGDVPQAPNFFLIKALRKPGKDSVAVEARIQYLQFLSKLEANKDLAYSEIDHLNFYRELSTPTGEKCISIVYMLRYNELKKWDVYQVQIK